VTGVNTHVLMSSGPNAGHLREVDIEVGDLIVQVKGGGARGLTSQIQKTITTTGRPTIGYAPDAPYGMIQNAARQGINIATNMNELLEFVRRLS